MFHLTTLFVLPALIILYILVELGISKDGICKSFHFLEIYTGKGLFLLMLALMLLEKGNAVEIVFGLAIFAICVMNIVAQILNRNKNPNNAAFDEESPHSSHTHLIRADSIVGSNVE